MASLVEHISIFLTKHELNNCQLVVAYSGGLDSTVLLHACSKLKNSFQISAIHINHQISQQSDAWALHCERQCEALNIPFKTQKVDIEQYRDKGLEAAAREARYRAFEELTSVYSDDVVILLAQHQDDQAETLLLQLLRGAGTKGLSSMPAVSSHENGQPRRARPFLDVSQQSLVEYAKAENLQWIEDESNLDETLNRNYLRHQIMPLLAKRFPSVNASFSRSAELCAQEHTVVNEYMALLATELIKSDGSLILSALSQQSIATQNAFVRYWLNYHDCSMPSSAVLSEITNMQNARQDATPEVELGDKVVYRYGGCLCVYSKTSLAKKDNAADQFFDGNSLNQGLSDNLKWHDITGTKLKLRLSDTTDTGLKISRATLTTKCKLHQSRPRKSLKQWSKEWGIPAQFRSKLRVVYRNETPIAVLDEDRVFVNYDTVINSEINQQDGKVRIAAEQYSVEFSLNQ